MIRGMALVLVGVAGSVAAEPVIHAFEWQGAGDYIVKGALEYDGALIMGRFVRDVDLSCFIIEGHKAGEPIGRWALTMLNEQTTWRLHFDPVAGRFVVDGEGIWMPQAWNMNGDGVDCGAGGFGFNIGNAAQDICVDNQLIFESQVAPDKAFPAVRVDDFEFPRDACKGPELLGLLQ